MWSLFCQRQNICTHGIALLPSNPPTNENGVDDESTRDG